MNNETFRKALDRYPAEMPLHMGLNNDPSLVLIMPIGEMRALLDLRADQMAATIRLPDTPEQQAEILAAIEKQRSAPISVFKPGIREGLELAAAWHDSAAAMADSRVSREFHEWSAQELRKLDDSGR